MSGRRPQPDAHALAADLDRRLALSPWVELRTFEPAHLWVGPDSDRAAAVRWAADRNRAGHGVYATFNRFDARPAGGGYARDQHVAGRTLLFLDVDVTRPADESDRSATEAERFAVAGLADALAAELAAAGWGEPAVRLDTGNGQAVYYPCEPGIPPAAVKALLSALAARHDTPTAHLDTGVFNPARVSRLAGSVNTKGETPRPCRLLTASPDPVTVTVAMVAMVAEAVAVLPAHPAEPPPFADAAPPAGGTPGADFNARGDWWADVLRPAGAKPAGRRGEVEHVTRPGKGAGASATLGWYAARDGTPVLFPFTDAWPELPARRPVDKFGAFARLFHRGDHSAAAKALRAKGYGGPPSNGRAKPRGGGVPPPPAETTPSPDRRPQIVVGTDQFRVNAEAAAALASEPDLFQMGGALVAVAALPTADTADGPRLVRRPAGLPVVRPVPPPLVAERLTRAARFVEKKSRKGEVVHEPCHPPGWCVQAVHARGDWPAVRRLDALAPYPVFLPDGRVLAAPGYDPDTGLFLADVPPLAVPDRPTPAQARAAAAELLDLVGDFPFAGDEHRAAWLAALLTPLAWFAFDGPAPLFVADGNTPGAGKGKLLHVIALILTGRPFAVTTYDNDPAETKKVITTLAVQGDRVVLLDNLAGRVGNAHLDAALTHERQWKGRVLGQSRDYEGPFHVTFYASGNNVQFAGDTPRRVCQMRLESAHENPEERTDFKRPRLVEHVRANRPALLAAALTILRGWHVAGRPTAELTEWGTYERWGAVVRQAVAWATGADPGDARLTRSAGGNPDLERLASLLAGWRLLDPDGQGLTAGGVVQRCRAPEDGERTADLRATIEELCGKLDPLRLGQRVGAFRGRNAGGFTFVRAGVTNGAVRWKAARVGATAGKGVEGVKGVVSDSPAADDAEPCPAAEGGEDIPW